MKNYDYTYLHQLMMYKLTDIISPEEERQLEQLIREDPAIKDLWEKMQKEHPKERVEAKYQAFEKDWISASTITSRPRHKARPIAQLVKRVSMAAAVLTGIGIGIYWITTNKPAGEHTTGKIAINQNNKAVRLTLAGGQVIDLSQQHDSMSVAGAQLANTNKNLSYTISPNGTDGPWAGRMNKLTVPIGRDYHVILSDGTEIWLNSATELQFPFQFGDDNREITVRGEAYLKIGPDADRPFLVHTPNGTVQVLGTEFNVNSYDSLEVRVALVNGAVRFSAAGEKANLKPGKEAVYRVNKGIQIQTFDPHTVLAWQKGHYYFYEASLPEITAVLPRWFGISVVMDKPALGKEKFTGMMNRNVPIDVFLTNIKFTMNIDYYFDKDSVLHFK